jgi:hypothetical protein
MLFSEKINLSQKILHKYSPMISLDVIGPLKEEYNYRNKSVYSFNLEKNLLDQVSFQIIGLDHSKIIQYLNIKNRKDRGITKNYFSIKDIFIKNNWKQEYQICLCIYCIDNEYQRLVKYLFNLMKSIITDLDINIVSAYYHLYDKKISLKNREMKRFYGIEKLEEILTIKGLGKKKIWFFPHSFSRVNYLNSQIIYQKVWDICSKLSGEGNYKYVMFGRDLYFPLKILLGLPRKIGLWGITHCPITYRDVIEDRENRMDSICQYVEKSHYIQEISQHIQKDLQYGEVNYVFVLTAGRNGLGQGICQMLVDFRHLIKTIIYVGCNRKNMDLDLSRLVGVGKDKYRIDKCYISNEFSLTDYNNNIIVLV